MPSSPPVVFVPPSAGSPPGAPDVVFVPPSAGSPPAAPGAVHVVPGGGGPTGNMVVSGVTSNPNANGTYLQTGSILGKPLYSKGTPMPEFAIQTLMYGDEPQYPVWMIVSQTGDLFRSEMNWSMGTPDQVPLWIAIDGLGAVSVVPETNSIPAPPAIFPGV